MTKTKSNEAALAETLAAGTQKHLAGVAQILAGGTAYTPAQIEAQLHTLATLRANVNAAKADLKGRLAEEKAKGPALAVFLHIFEGIVRAAFDGQPDVLADFGLAPRKVPTPLTPEEKAAAKAKRAATRLARGTIGKKKKLAIKGNVTGVVVTPVTQPPPAPPVTTAPAAAPVVNGAAHS